MNRWKVTVVILLVWLLVATGLGGYVQSQNIEQRNQITGLQEQVATLEEQVITLEEQVATLEEQNENLLVEITDLKSEIETLGEKIDNLKDYLPFLDIFEMEATVVRVIDGDTIEVDIIGMRFKVRYIGIDTPELHDKQPEFRALAQEATRLNRELVEGKTVRLEKDVSGTDNFGRLLRYVYVGNTFVNAELVRQGLAWAEPYEPDTKYQDYLEELEMEAGQAGRGLWAPTLSPE